MSKILPGIPCLGFNSNLNNIAAEARSHNIDMFVLFNFKNKDQYEENLDRIAEFHDNNPEVNCMVDSSNYNKGLLFHRLAIIKWFSHLDYDYLIQFDSDDTLTIPYKFEDCLSPESNSITKFNFKVNELRTNSTYDRYICNSFELTHATKFMNGQFFPGVAFSCIGKELATNLVNQFAYTSIPKINLCEDLAITLMALSCSCSYKLVADKYLGIYNNDPISTTFSSDPNKDYESTVESLNYVFFVLKPFYYDKLDMSWFRYLECVTKSYAYYVVKKKFEGISYS